MNRTESLALLGISDGTEEEIIEAFEERLFRLRNELLGHSGVPAWITSKVRTLSHLRRASQTLGLDPLTDQACTEISLSARDPLGFLRSYEEALANVRLGISAAGTFSELLRAMNLWERVQIWYATSFGEVLKGYISDEIPAAAQTTAADTARMIQLIKSGDHPEETTTLISAEWNRVRGWIR